MILACVLLLFPLLSLTAEVTCYSGKTRIYHGYGHDFMYDDKWIGFTDNKTNHVTIIFGDCIIDAPMSFWKNEASKYK
jgi:hypothetical protein